MWTGIIIGAVVVAAYVAFQINAPARRRKKAVNEAVARARTAVAANPDDAGARIRLGRVLLDLAREPNEALERLEEIDRDDPTSWHGEEKPTRMLVGEAYVALGRLERAIEVFQSFVDDVSRYDTGDDSERKWRLETHKVEAEQRIRLLKKGDTHVHQPEQWGDASSV